jgi:hypothetical protein
VMTPRLIAGLFAFGLATTGAVVATLVVSVMIEEINRKKPNGEQISDLGSTPFKDVAHPRRVRRLCPAGRLHVYYWALAMSRRWVFGAIGAIAALTSPRRGPAQVAPVSTSRLSGTYSLTAVCPRSCGGGVLRPNEHITLVLNGANVSVVPSSREALLVFVGCTT